MTQDKLKQMALMQSNGDDFFIVGDEVYKGTEEDVRSEYESSYLAYFTEDAKEFKEWIETESDYEVIDNYDDSGDYLVLTDDEADDKWDELLESYIDEIVFSEIPENYQYYFDRESWKKDAQIDGRGHSISSYDGEENYEIVKDNNGVEYAFFIYRMN